MRDQKRRFVNASLIALFVAASIGARCTPSAAQEPFLPANRLAVAPSQASAPPFPFLSVLRGVAYDPNERGPLLVLVPQPFVNLKTQNETPPPCIASLSDFADATDTRLFAAGQMNVLAPRVITILNSKPGKANPFGDLSPAETLKLLLSTFTPAQWRIAGGATGIGSGYLTDDQKLLWAQMLPLQGQVQKTKIEAGTPPLPLRYTETGLIDVHPRATGRLRLSKTLDFAFYKRGGGNIEYGAKWSGSGWENMGPRSGDDIAWISDPYQDTRQIGSERLALTAFMGWFSLAPERPDPKTYRAYGALLLVEQPNRLKIGAVDFAAPILDKRIPLGDFPAHVSGANGAPMDNAAPETQKDGALLPTVGDVLMRITHATGVEFVADRRVRDISVYLHGDRARTGDILMALALGVGGAFRKMEPSGDANKTTDIAPLYLLTDDIEGIGTRVGRLGEWANAADALKYRTLAKVEEAAVKNDPLAALAFAPGDPLALPLTQTKKIEDNWRAKKYAAPPDLLAADLSPALKKAVQDFVDARAGEGVSLESGCVRIGEDLHPYLLFPEVQNRAVEAGQLGNAIGRQYLQAIAFDPAKHSAEEAKPVKPAALIAPGFDRPILQKQRRILIARPKTRGEAVQIVRAAIGRGIGEVWLEINLADPKASAELLTGATEAGGKKIAVGASIRLLKRNDDENGGSLGEPDRNILGETGETFRARAESEYSSDKAFFARYQKRLKKIAGWSAINGADAPAAVELRRRALVIAGVPNLAGLTFRATGGPGWTGIKESGDGLYTNAAQGYTDSTRRAFLRDFGIDPIDIPDLPLQLRDIYWNVNYFTANDGRAFKFINGQIIRPRPEEMPRPAWWAFRKKRNMELAASVFTSVRVAHPNLPLYTDDRLSSYGGANTDWFGSWDTPGGLPDFSPYYEGTDALMQARRTSKTVFFHWGSDWGANDAAKPDAPATFARRVSASALQNPPPSWNGLVIDLSDTPGASVPALLEGLPKTTITPRP